MSFGNCRLLLLLGALKLSLIVSSGHSLASDDCLDAYHQIDAASSLPSPKDIINEKVNKLRRTMFRPDGALDSEVTAQTEAILKDVAEALRTRGIETRLLSSHPANRHAHPVLQILSPAEASSDLTSRNLRSVARDVGQDVSVVYDPVSLLRSNILGSWNAEDLLMRVDIDTLLEPRKLPATLIHERLHFEKALAISRKSSGPLRPFYGYFDARRELVGNSSYAKGGHLSVDEVKAWMTTQRSEEQTILRLLKQPSPAPNIMRARIPNLMAEQKHYVTLIEDVIVHLEAVESFIKSPKLPRSVTLDERGWFGEIKNFSATVRTSVGPGPEFEYVVPLVKLKTGASREAVQAELLDQVQSSLKASRNHQDIAKRRLEVIQNIASLDETAAREEFLKFMRRTPSN